MRDVRPRNYRDGMNWQEYVTRHLEGRTQVALAKMAGVTGSTVSKWMKGTQGFDAQSLIRLARGVGDDPLDILVRMGVLTPDEAKVRPTAPPDYSQLSNDQLLQLVRDRMRPGCEPGTNPGHGRVTEAESNPDDPLADADDLWTNYNATKKTPAEGDV